MPRYDFICPECQQRFEAIVPVTDLTRACDRCLIHAEKLVLAQRQLSAPSRIHIH